MVEDPSTDGANSDGLLSLPLETCHLLLQGGSGAVGIFAIQLARNCGAHVITTASRRNFDFLTRLGAHEVIDYRDERFEEKTNIVSSHYLARKHFSLPVQSKR